MSSEIRAYIKHLDLDDFVEECYRKTQLPKELLQDATLEILTKILAQESNFNGRFENAYAFHGYVRKSALRRAWNTYQDSIQKEKKLENVWLFEGSDSPEDMVLSALEHQSFVEVVKRVLHRTNEAQGLLNEGHELIEVIMSAPDTYIQRRESGKKKGHLVFNYVALMKALGWNKQKLYDRLERIRKVFVKELKQNRNG